MSHDGNERSGLVVREAACSEYMHDAALSDLMIEPEIWVIRPHIQSVIDGSFGNDLLDGSRIRDALGRAVPLLRSSGFELALSEDRTLFAWNTENQRRSFGRLLDHPAVVRFESQRGYRGSLVRALEGRRQFDLTRRNRRLLRQLVEQLDIWDRSVRARFERLLGLAILEIYVARRLFQTHRPRKLVAATQHNVRVRAALVAAHAAGVPTVYVPHAPAANNRIYRDLPFDLAALRGPLEVDYYTDLGADPGRLHVVGDLSLSVRADSLPCPDGPIVVAPSPWEAPRVEKFIAMVDAGIKEPFVVCPHPRADVAHMRELLPERAHLVEGERTLDVIARGCGAVVQNSSGVAVEAMLLGTPVIEVPANGQPPTYLAISEPYVRIATTPAELHQAVSTRAPEARLHDVERARTWVRGWTAYTGTEAEARLRALLAWDIQPSGALLDEWAPSDRD